MINRNLKYLFAVRVGSYKNNLKKDYAQIIRICLVFQSMRIVFMFRVDYSLTISQSKRCCCVGYLHFLKLRIKHLVRFKMFKRCSFEGSARKRNRGYYWKFRYQWPKETVVKLKIKWHWWSLKNSFLLRMWGTHLNGKSEISNHRLN